jgi:hypothetical protein
MGELDDAVSLCEQTLRRVLSKWLLAPADLREIDDLFLDCATLPVSRRTGAEGFAADPRIAARTHRNPHVGRVGGFAWSELVGGLESRS